MGTDLVSFAWLSRTAHKHANRCAVERRDDGWLCIDQKNPAFILTGDEAEVEAAAVQWCLDGSRKLFTRSERVHQLYDTYTVP